MDYPWLPTRPPSQLRTVVVVVVVAIFKQNLSTIQSCDDVGLIEKTA